MPRPMPIPNAMALLRVECEDTGVLVGEDSVAVGWDMDSTDKMLRSVVALGTIFSTSSTALRWGFTRSNFPLLIVSLLRLFSPELRVYFFLVYQRFVEQKIERIAAV